MTTGEASARAPYQPDKLLWGAIASGVAPGVGLLVSLACARFATPETRKKILGIAGLDLVLLITLLGVLGAGVSIERAGYEPRPLLGVEMSDDASDGGVRLVGVVPGSAADSAGLVAGDTVLSIDGVAVDDADALGEAIAQKVPEAAVALAVRDADGARRETQATLGTNWMPSPRSAAFHALLRSIVLGLAFFSAIALGIFGAFRGRPRWVGVALAMLAGWAFASAFLLVLPDHVWVPAVFVAAVLAFSLSVHHRMRRAAPPMVRLVDRTSRGFVLGLLAAGSFGVRATLAVYLIAALADVTPAVVSNTVLGTGQDGSTAESQLIIGALLVLLAPVLEELFFRGALLPWLTTFMSPPSAIALSALLFGALHVPTHGLHCLVATAYGGALGWTYLRTRSLVPCLIIHALINAAAALRFLL